MNDPNRVQACLFARAIIKGAGRAGHRKRRCRLHDNRLKADPTETPSDRRDEQGDQWFHYILIDEIEQWTALGWEIVADLSGTPHERYSVLGKWCGVTIPVIPSKT